MLSVYNIVSLFVFLWNKQIGKKGIELSPREKLNSKIEIQYTYLSTLYTYLHISLLWYILNSISFQLRTFIQQSCFTKFHLRSGGFTKGKCSKPEKFRGEKWEKSAGFQTDFFAKCLGCISWHQKTDGLSTVTVSQWKHFQVLQVRPCSSKSQKAWQQDQEGAKNQEAEQIKQDLQLLTITITSHDAKNWHKVWGCCVLSWVLWNKTWVKGIKDKTHASLECCYDVARTFPESAPFLCWDIQKERNKIESRIPT